MWTWKLTCRNSITGRYGWLASWVGNECLAAWCTNFTWYLCSCVVCVVQSSAQCTRYLRSPERANERGQNTLIILAYLFRLTVRIFVNFDYHFNYICTFRLFPSLLPILAQKYTIKKRQPSIPSFPWYKENQTRQPPRKPHDTLYSEGKCYEQQLNLRIFTRHTWTMYTVYLSVFSVDGAWPKQLIFAVSPLLVAAARSQLF